MTQIARPELSDEELKAKWSRPRAEIEADLARNPPAPNSALQAAQELPSVRICPDCQAHGVRKVQYGYRVMDEVCDRCEGDCDSDSDCKAGLTCFQRDTGSVPGCSGVATTDWDYCIPE